MEKATSDQIFLNTRVASVSNESTGGVRVIFENNQSELYDHVVLATHAPQALKIIAGSATPLEVSILSNFQTSKNRAVLHSDISLMPMNVKTWSSWNYLTMDDCRQICLTYNMNKLQAIPSSDFGPILVTLNPIWPPRESRVQGVFDYDHPLYTPAAVKAQGLLPQIQGVREISYIGAWTKYGFHEDAFTSALNVAVTHLGASLPFPINDNKLGRGKVPAVQWTGWILRAFLCGIQLLICLIEFLWSKKDLGIWKYSKLRSKSE
jgi:predicted NAD/FAD-binding protein